MVLLGYPDPLFHKKAEPRAVDDGLRAIGTRLLAATEAAKAYGLAAIHIGALAPVAVISVAEDPAQRDYRVLYNPVIRSTSGALVAGPEGSVSLPGVEVEISRPEMAVIGFDESEGLSQELTLTGWPVRIALHEIEQVNGIYFLSHLSRLKREMALKKARKLREA